MPLTLLQLVGAGTSGTTQSDAANIDIPEDGEITAVDMNVWSGSTISSATILRAQLSFISSHQIGTNDARGVISEVMMSAVFNTSGAAKGDTTKQVTFSPGLKVSAGERLHVHTNNTGGTATPNFQIMIHLNTDRPVARRARRRR